MATPGGGAKRETWGSKFAFVLAAAGSAVGLGNIWRFPTETGENGGAAFVVIYLICVIVVGLPIMLCELILGRRSQRNPVGAFDAIAPGTSWKAVGGMGVVTGLAILSYYAVVAGWTLGYVYKIIAGDFSGESDSAAVAGQFGEFVGNPVAVIVCLVLFMALTVVVVAGGVRAGIERWTKVLMPVLFVMLVLLVIRSVTLDGAAEGLRFYLEPDLSQITLSTVIAALGQAFFSLSLGMGAMITYGSYLSKKEDLISAGVMVMIADTSVALLAGFAIFPALFTVEGLEPTAGAGLIFVVLPNVFNQIPLGMIFGAAFFGLLCIAALTSTVSLLEVVAAYLIDERGWSRLKATTLTGAFCTVLAIPSALSAGASDSLTRIYQADGSWKGFLDLFDTIFGNIMLVAGGLLIAIFVGWRMGLDQARDELEEGRGRFSLFSLWAVLVKFVCPLALLMLLGQFILTTIRSLGG